MNPPSWAGETPATRAGAVLLLAALAGLLGVSLLWNLGHPLLWNDEAETVAYGQRILVFGYPKISDGHNWVFALDAPLSLGRLPDSDAYVGSVWGQYYLAALGVLAARGVGDLYARTACFRLPFVLAGVAGLATTAAALAAVRRGRRPGRPQIHRRSLQEAGSSLFMGREQGINLAAQGGVSIAGPVEERRAVNGSEGNSLIQQPLHPLPARPVHATRPLLTIVQLVPG